MQVHGWTDAQGVALVDFENNAKHQVAALRGIADNALNVYWSRGEIRAYMYLQLLDLANAPADSLSADDQVTVTYFTKAINLERVSIGAKALDLYNEWDQSPCGFKVPVGDPNAYLDQSSVYLACHLPRNSPACLMGGCTPHPPSAARFTAWATADVAQHGGNSQIDRLTYGMDQWAAALQKGGLSQLHHLHLTDKQAHQAAAFEYDAEIGGVAEGVAYLTAKHARVANVPPAEESASESDLQEKWLEALHDFAGDHFKELVQDAVTKPFVAFGQSVADGFGPALEDGAELVAEEDIAGELMEGWDTVVGPALAAGAVIAYSIWQVIEDAEVPQKLAAAFGDDEDFPQNTLAYYASTEDGRSLILAAVVRSTTPDFTAYRLANSSAAATGPAKPSDPWFVEGDSAQPTGSFTTDNWDGVAHLSSVSTSVRNGWFVQQRGSGAFRYTPVIHYQTPYSNDGCVTYPDGSMTCTIPSGDEQWEAWLDGDNFLAERVAIDAGYGYVTSGVNGCGGHSMWLPVVGTLGNGTNIFLNDRCVLPNDDSFSFALRNGDEVDLAGQIRTVKEVVTNSAGKVTAFQTSAPFGEPVVYGPQGQYSETVRVAVLAHPDGNCLTSSSLGNRVQDPDCTYGPSISTSSGTVTLIKATQIISGFTPTTFPYSARGSLTVSAVGGASGNPVTFSSTTPRVCTSGGPNGASISIQSAGNCVLDAHQDGNANYAPASAEFVVVITKLAQSITGLYSNPASPMYDPGNEFLVNATPGTSGEPVTFSIASASTSVCAITGQGGNGVAVKTTAAGTCTVLADEAGSTDYDAAPQVSLAVTVTKAWQVISGFAPDNVVYRAGGRFTVSADAVPGNGIPSGNPVTFSSTMPSVCTSGGTNGATITMHSRGLCILDAHVDGNSNYLPASAQFEVGIDKMNQTIADVMATPANPAYSANGTFTVSATPGASNELLQFSVDAASTGICELLGEDGSSAMIRIDGVGTCTVLVNQPGNDGYYPAPQVSLAVTIGKAAQAITGVHAPVFAYLVPGDTFPVSATGGASGYPVTFTSKTPNVCTTGGTDGATVTVVAIGTCTLAANQAGDTDYQAAPEANFEVIIINDRIFADGFE